MDKDKHDATSKVGEVVSDLSTEAINRSSEYYREGTRAVASTVKEQPLGSLVAAGVIGFILALIISR